MNALLFIRWDPDIECRKGSPLGGLFLSFDGLKISKYGRMMAEDPTYIHYKVVYDALVFSPLPG